VLATETRLLFDGSRGGRCVQVVDVLLAEDHSRLARFVNLHVPPASQRRSCTQLMRQVHDC